MVPNSQFFKFPVCSLEIRAVSRRFLHNVWFDTSILHSSRSDIGINPFGMTTIRRTRCWSSGFWSCMDVFPPRQFEMMLADLWDNWRPPCKNQRTAFLKKWYFCGITVVIRASYFQPSLAWVLVSYQKYFWRKPVLISGQLVISRMSYSVQEPAKGSLLNHYCS